MKNLFFLLISIKYFASNMSSGKITLITGPMFSGKTNALIKIVDEQSRFRKKCLFIKNCIDKRYTEETKIVAHNNNFIDTSEYITTTFMNSLDEVKRVDNYEDYNVIAIDEGHFFEKLSFYSNLFADDNKYVVISSLNSDFNQKSFNEVLEIIPHCDEIITKNSICQGCNDSYAIYSILKNKDSEHEASTSKILVGGNDTYMVVCRRCK